MKTKIKKRLVLLIAVAGILFSNGVTAFAYTNETEQQAVESGTSLEAADAAEVETAEEMETPIQEESPSEAATPFSVAGNGQLLDDKSEDDTKQFLTIQTKNGNTFFLVLDRSSNTENVYMLSMIDEKDLAEFLEETDTQETEAPAVVVPEQETTPAPEDTEIEPEKKDSGMNMGAVLAIVLVLVGGIGGYYYFKVVKPREEEDAEGEDLEFYDGGAYINEDQEDAEEVPDDFPEDEEE